MAKKGKLSKFAAEEKEERPLRYRRYDYLFLIVCEDQFTEPTYFEKYKAKIPEETIFLKSVGTGKDAKGVVNKAIEEREKLTIKAKKEVDIVWVVFDKDDADENATKIKNFEDAFLLAENEKIEIAYSNEVFELWLLLHLVNINKNIALPRGQIYEMLQAQIRKTKKYESYVYDHKKPNLKTIEIIFEIGNVDLAIKRAEILLESQKNRKPIEANPSTKVHLLIQQLFEWIEYYSSKS